MRIAFSVPFCDLLEPGATARAVRLQPLVKVAGPSGVVADLLGRRVEVKQVHSAVAAGGRFGALSAASLRHIKKES